MGLRSFQNRSPLGVVQFSVIVFLLGAYLGVVTGQEKKDSDGPITISAQKFILVDQKGNERGSWRVDDDRVSFDFTDKDGKAWVNIWAVMRDDGVAYLSIGDSNNKRSHIKLVSWGANANVSVFDKWIPGTTRNLPKASLGVRKGAPILELKDLPRKSSATISVRENAPLLELYDKKGELTWSAPQKEL